MASYRTGTPAACESTGQWYARFTIQVVLRYPEDTKNLKTAWEYYNEGTSAAASPYTV